MWIPFIPQVVGVWEADDNALICFKLFFHPLMHSFHSQHAWKVNCSLIRHVITNPIGENQRPACSDHLKFITGK